MKREIVENINLVLQAINTIPVQDIQHCRNKVYAMDILTRIADALSKEDITIRKTEKDE